MRSGGISSTVREDAEAHLARHPVGSSVAVRSDPDDPSRAVLEPGGGWGALYGDHGRLRDCESGESPGTSGCSWHMRAPSGSERRRCAIPREGPVQRAVRQPRMGWFDGSRPFRKRRRAMGFETFLRSRTNGPLWDGFKHGSLDGRAGGPV
jgi:hypothetical protein